MTMATKGEMSKPPMSGNMRRMGSRTGSVMARISLMSGLYGLGFIQEMIARAMMM